MRDSARTPRAAARFRQLRMRDRESCSASQCRAVWPQRRARHQLAIQLLLLPVGGVPSFRIRRGSDLRADPGKHLNRRLRCTLLSGWRMHTGSTCRTRAVARTARRRHVGRRRGDVRGRSAHAPALDARMSERRARWRRSRKRVAGGVRSCSSVLHAVIAMRPTRRVRSCVGSTTGARRQTARTTVTSFRRAMHREGYVLKKNGRGRARSIGRTSRRSAARS